MLKKRSECTCSCHTDPHMKHMVACCQPDAEHIYDLELFIKDRVKDAIKEESHDLTIFLGPAAYKALHEAFEKQFNEQYKK